MVLIAGFVVCSIRIDDTEDDMISQAGDAQGDGGANSGDVDRYGALNANLASNQINIQ